jgi:hypothetical protein
MEKQVVPWTDTVVKKRKYEDWYMFGKITNRKWHQIGKDICANHKTHA